jgi:hypothetical protein
VRRFVFVALSLTFALASAGARAEDDPGNAQKALRGFRYVLKPALAYDLGTRRADLAKSVTGQDVTFALSDHIGWAFPIGPLVVSPGASLPIYFFDNNVTLGVLGEVELHLPLRWISPYVVLGGGAAIFFGAGRKSIATEPSCATPMRLACADRAGGFLRVGAGATVFPVKWLGVGGQLAYVQMGDVSILEVSWPIELRF